MAEVTEEYNQKYAVTITPAGLAAIAAAVASKEDLKVTHVAFGDGAGGEYLPDKTQTDIKNEVYVTESADIFIDPSNPAQVIVSTKIPPNAGGWYVREAALRLESGETMAVGTMSTIYKPRSEDGAGMGIAYEFALLVSNTEVFELKMSSESEAIRNAIDAHNNDADAHGGLVQQAVDSAKDAVQEAVKDAQDAAQQAQGATDTIREEFTTLREEILQEVAKARTIYDFSMERIDNTVKLTVADLPETLPPLLTLRGKATADYQYSDTILVNDAPVRLLTPDMYPIVDSAWSAGGSFHLVWDTGAKQLSYQMTVVEMDDGTGGNDGGSTTPKPVVSDWREDVDYEITDLVYGSDKGLYEAIYTSGPKYEVGARDPVVEIEAESKPITMQTVTLPYSGDWRPLAFGGGKYVAAMWNSDKAATSENGVNWSPVSLPFISYRARMAYGAGAFIIPDANRIVGADPKRSLYSRDGIAWSSIDLPYGLGYAGIIFANEKFYIFRYSNVVDSNHISISADGINWDKIIIPEGLDPDNLNSKSWDRPAFGNGKLICVNGNGYSSTGIICEDGQNWSGFSLPFSMRYWNDAAFGNDTFVAISSLVDQDSGYAAYSKDGHSWTGTMLPYDGVWRIVEFCHGAFIALASNSNKAAYSFDGKAWYGLTLPFSAKWENITSNNNRNLVAVASDAANKALLFTINKNQFNCWKRVG